MPPRVECAWCHKVKREGPEPTSHGICFSCAREIKERELVKFSLILLNCSPFEEVITRAGAASILRAVRTSDLFINYEVRTA